MIYEKGNTVVCAGSGVCKIIDIRKERFAEKAEYYYILSPVYEQCPTKLFIPVASENKRIRALISEQEIQNCISQAANSESLWIEEEKIREKLFHDIVKSGDYIKMIKMISEIHKVQKEKKKAGGKLRQSDERIMKEAEGIINNEFAFVLNIPTSEVKNYILNLM